MKTKTNTLVLTLVILFSLIFSLNTFAGKKNVELSTSEPDAEIIVDGRMLGKGYVNIIIPKDVCVTVYIVKTGFLTETMEFCNQKYRSEPPKKYFVKMTRDDAYDASVLTDIANVSIELRTEREELEAWKLMSQIITSYFDIIEITDRETGYLRTSWVIKSYKQNTIRTRLLITLGDSDPLMYKVKLICEESQEPGTSVKKDEKFKEWDRVLRKYENVIEELKARL